jgi:hypothetical protein
MTTENPLMAPRFASPEDDDPDDLSAEAVFDRVFSELLGQEFKQTSKPCRKLGLQPSLRDAGAALHAIFDANQHLTADLSFDQVYAKVLPHLITIMNAGVVSRRARFGDAA